MSKQPASFLKTLYNNTRAREKPADEDEIEGKTK